MSEHVSFLCFMYLIFLHPSVLPKAQHINPLTHFSRLASTQFADCITCLASNHFVSVWTDTAFLPVHSLQFWIWTCLNMFHFHVLLICHFSIPVCNKRLSRRSTYTFLVAWLVHNLLIALPPSPPTILSNCLSASSLVLYIYTFFSLNMPKHLSFLCFIHLLFLHSSVPP